MANDVRIHVSVEDDASTPLKHVKDRTDDLADSAGRADTSTKTLNGSMSNLSKIASAFIVSEGLTKLSGFLFDAAKGAAEDEAAQLKLQKAVENTGASYSAYSEALATTIVAAQKRGYTDDQARASLSLLVAQTGDATEAQKRFALAQDLSRGAGIDLETASRLLGKVTEDNVQVLKRFGISAREGATETELFGAVAEKFAGQSDLFAQSSAGQMAAAKIQMGELKEAIGSAVLPAITALAGALTSLLIPAIKFLSEDTTKSRVALGLLVGVITTVAIAAVVALTAVTYGYVAALGAQAIAFALANPLLAVAAVAAGVLMAATVALIVVTKKSTDATEEDTAGQELFADRMYESTKATQMSKEEVEAHQKATEDFTKATTYLTAAVAAQAFASSIAAAAVRGSAEEQVAAEETGLRLVKTIMLQAAANKAVVDGLMSRAESELGLGTAQKYLTSSTQDATRASRDHSAELKDEKRAADDLQSSIDKLIRTQQSGLSTSLPGNLASDLGPVKAAEVLADLRRMQSDANRLDVLAAANKAVSSGALDPGQALDRVNRILSPGAAASTPSDLDRIFGGSSGTTINVAVSGIVLDPVGTGRAIADALNQASLSTGALVLSGAVQQ